MRIIEDRNVLDAFCMDFCRVLERHTRYIVVSGFLAISSGRTRGTEDIDVILERLDEEKFKGLHQDLVKNGFECIQGEKNETLFSDYLEENLSLRYVRKGHLLPEMEVKLAKDVFGRTPVGKPGETALDRRGRLVRGRQHQHRLQGRVAEIRKRRGRRPSPASRFFRPG